MNLRLRDILSSGARKAGPLSKVRSIQLTNAIALITACLFIILVSYLILTSGWTMVSAVGIVTILALLSVIGLNHFLLYNISRCLMCVVIPLAVLAAIFLPRINLIGEYRYFRSADVFCILITSSMIPLLIYSLRERRAIWMGLIINLLILLLFDFTFYRFSNLNSQAPYTILRFVASNFVLLIMFVFLASSLAFLKDLFEFFELNNNKLINQLHLKNDLLQKSNLDLYELNQSIEAQNEEIKSQSEELAQGQEHIMRANIEIERQKTELEEKNSLLEASLGERNFDLLQTNRQLIHQNSELQQFSFTVSHNLRAPVASMRGLLNLYTMSQTEEEKAHLIRLFENSTQSLDTIIQDLGKIVDIRHDNFNLLEKVNLQVEVDLVMESLRTFISSNEVTINIDLRSQELISIKAYLNSILFNLISNAIQYRSLHRKPIITISSKEEKELIVLEVSDNGVGIDLKKYRQDMFKLYKRFHAHVPGKGLGLFIVKQQVDKLNAKIEVESDPDKGTTFRVFFKK